MDEVKPIPPRETEESSTMGMVNSEKNVLESKVFKNGAIYLFIRADYQKPTWMVRLKVPNRKGYIYRSTRTTDEHEAFKFADDLYNKELVKVLGGEKPAGQKIVKAIDGYVERYQPERTKLSIHYKLLLLNRCKPFLERKTFDQLWMSTDGTYYLPIKYGKQNIELQKGMVSIECQNLDEVEHALCEVRTMVLAGKLDDQMENASAAIRQRFKKA